MDYYDSQALRRIARSLERIADQVCKQHTCRICHDVVDPSVTGIMRDNGRWVHPNCLMKEQRK